METNGPLFLVSYEPPYAGVILDGADGFGGLVEFSDAIPGGTAEYVE